MTRIPRPSRDHVMLVIAIVTALAGSWVFISHQNLPVAFDTVYSVLNDVSPMAIGAVIAVVLLGVTVIRSLAGGSSQLDRSPIISETPELPSLSPVPEASGMLETTYAGVREQFDSPGTAERRLAMYGRRVETVEPVSSDVEQFLDELTVTARDTYATATSCDLETAERAVADGHWTNNRIAAAFLASDPGAAPDFTTFERMMAWIAPERTFERRVGTVLEAIEETADVYLTYENPNDNSAVTGDRSMESNA